jgi:hypothetical protein
LTKDAISGKPTASGIFSIQVAATDSAKLTGTATLSLTVLPADAFTIDGLTIPSTHPRLWFNDPNRLARAVTYFAAHPFKPGSPSSDGFQAAFDTALMHAVSGSDCTPAITWAVALANSPPDVPLSKNAGSDWIRNYGEAVIVTFDWCYGQLSALDKTTLITKFNTYFGNVEQQTWGGLYNGTWMTQSNYFWANIRTELEWGIATHGESDQADGFVDYALQKRWAATVSLDATTDRGGITQEGHDYGPTTTAYSIVPIATSLAAGRDLLAENNFFMENLFWLLYATLPAPTYNRGVKADDWEFFAFADDEHSFYSGNRPQIFYYGDFMTVMSSQYATSPAGGYAQQWLGQVKPHQTHFTLPENSSTIKPLAFSALPLDFYGSGSGYMYGHKTWDASSTAFQWQLGSSAGGGHEHFDYGNFQIWRNGRWLTREACGYSNNIANFGNTGSTDIGHPEAHNTLFVNGMGINWRSQSLGPPVIRRLESRPGYTYANADLTASYHASSNYPTYDNPGLEHVERELVFVRSLETTIVFDRLTSKDISGGASAAKVVKSFLIHFENTPTLVDANNADAVNNTQALHVTTLLPAKTDARRVVNEAACSGCNAMGLYRMEEDTSGAAQSYFLHVLQGRDASASNLTSSVVDSNPASPTDGTFTVTLHPGSGSDVVIVFVKGIKSSAGSIAISGSNSPFRGDVQNMIVTDAGPVWQ